MGSDFGWVEVFEKKIVLDTKKGELLHIILQYPPPSPPLLPTILRNIFPPADVTVMGTLLHSTCKESFWGAPQSKDFGRFLIAQRPGMALK